MRKKGSGGSRPNAGRKKKTYKTTKLQFTVRSEFANIIKHVVKSQVKILKVDFKECCGSFFTHDSDCSFWDKN